MNQNGPNCSGKAAVMALQLNAVVYPYRVLFEDAMSGFKILSCRCETENVQIDPKYHSLTLKGSNLSILKIGDRADVVLEPIYDGRHPYGYMLVGYQGVNYESDRIELTPIAEMQSLTRIMTEQQAQNVHEAYPHFVAMILNGDDENISHKNIYNVGPKLLPKYIQQIKAMHMEVQFISSASAWGIESSGDIQKISTRYDSVKDFDAAIAENPYAVLVDVLEWGFVKADKVICLRHPDFINSRERAEAASISILKSNEQDGNTRMTANALFEQFTKLAPQAIQHLYQAVTESPRIHYDSLRKLTSLTSTYNAECLIADVLKKKIAHPHLLPMNWQEYINADGLSLTEEQAKILEMACSKDAMILTGAAGVGKSQSVKALIAMLEGNSFDYTLLAPTGIATKRLRESTGRAASTIHMALTTNDPIGKFLIVDEMGMVSVSLLAKLLERITDDTKIIFIADPAQLASISCGNVVRDLLDSGEMPVANLTKVFRYNSSGIITLSTDVRNGRNEHLVDTYADYKFVPISTQAIRQIEEEYAALVSGGYDPSDVLILSPFNKGPVGSMAINTAIQAKFNPNPMSGISYKRDGIEIGFKVGDMVINKKNEYSMPLDDGMDTAFVANGDIGTILAIDDMDCSMTVKFGCGICHVDRTHIQRLMLGYCISVHACQGSQAKAVMVVVDSSHGRMLSRNLLYTAMTRAQERLVVIGDVAAIEYGLGVQEEMERNTWLKELMMR